MKQRASCFRPSLLVAIVQKWLKKWLQSRRTFISLGLLSELGEVDRVFTLVRHFRVVKRTGRRKGHYQHNAHIENTSPLARLLTQLTVAGRSGKSNISATTTKDSPLKGVRRTTVVVTGKVGRRGCVAGSWPFYLFKNSNPGQRAPPLMARLR